MTVIHVDFRKPQPSRTDWLKLACEIVRPEPVRSPVCPMSEALARLRSAELGVEALASTLEATERRISIEDMGCSIAIDVRGASLVRTSAEDASA